MEKYISVEDVMSFINTSNRGSEDYFIVDQIEDLCNNKSKTLEELEMEQRVQDELKNPENIVAAFSYEHNDGDQIWDDNTKYYRLSDGTFRKTFYDGYYGETSTSVIEYDEIVAKMNYIENQVQQQAKAIEKYGYGSVFTRGGYTITVPLRKENIPLDSDLEVLFKKNNVRYCYYSYYRENKNTSVIIVFRNKDNIEEHKKNMMSFFNKRGIKHIHFNETISRTVDMNWNLLYSPLQGVVNQNHFDKVCGTVEEEEELDEVEKE